MRHRIFIAINLPEKIKKELINYPVKWPELPARWARASNLHITLVFLGYLLDEELLEIIKTAKEVSQRHEPFFICLTKICYGPPNKPARMIWAEGEKSKDLANLKNDLEKNLLENFTPYRNEVSGAGRPYAPHITLGRLRQWEFGKIEPEQRPEINEEINLKFEVSSIEVMESRLKRNGAEYTALESIPLAL